MSIRPWRDIQRKKTRKISRCFLITILSIYLTNILEFWGLQHLSAAKTCFIYSISPFFAAIFSYIHFGEKMNAQKSIGMFIGFLGFIPTILMQTENETFYLAGRPRAPSFSRVWV